MSGRQVRPRSGLAMNPDPLAYPNASATAGRAIRRLALAMGACAALAVVLTLDGPGLTIDEPLDVRPGRTYIKVIRDEGFRFFKHPVVDRVFKDNAEHPPLGRWLLGIASTLGEPFEVIWKGADPTGQYVLAGRLAPAICFAILVSVVTFTAGRRWSPVAGAAAGFALLAMPRVFAHAHLAALDTFLSLFWTLALLAGERAIRSPRPLRAMAVAGAIWSLALLTKIHAWLLLASTWNLGVRLLAAAPSFCRDLHLGSRRRQPVLDWLAMDLVRPATPFGSLLGHGRDQTDDLCAIFRPGGCGSRRSLALPLVLLCGNRPSGIAASRVRWLRPRLQESTDRRVSLAACRHDRHILAHFQHAGADLRWRTAVPARFSGMGAFDRLGVPHALEPLSNGRCPPPFSNYLERLFARAGLRHDCAAPIWSEFL